MRWERGCLFHPLLSFQTVPPTLTQPLLALIQRANLPYTSLTVLNKYEKGDFTSSTVAFYQKSVFDFLHTLTNI